MHTHTMIAIAMIYPLLVDISFILHQTLVYTRITHAGIVSINQDVDQDVLSEFQRSPFFKEMATNRLNPASSCVTVYHVGGQFISPEG